MPSSKAFTRPRAIQLLYHPLRHHSECAFTCCCPSDIVHTCQCRHHSCCQCTWHSPYSPIAPWMPLSALMRRANSIPPRLHVNLTLLSRDYVFMCVCVCVRKAPGRTHWSHLAVQPSASRARAERFRCCRSPSHPDRSIPRWTGSVDMKMAAGMAGAMCCWHPPPEVRPERLHRCLLVG